MTKAATVQARVDSHLKAKADLILKHIGISASQAINALYAQIVLRNGIPFDMRIPNDLTLAAIEELNSGGGKPLNNFNSLLDDLEQDDT
ncbi:MAG: addiction module antitoxin RelB [marine bacterium B5-7]|nr:MAG: addiction module antitoxin RelB [marine bacterium B5-7]